jgi:LmbE family N-acetylglucosaminyl deacetylase
MIRRYRNNFFAHALVLIAAWITIPAFAQAPVNQRANPNAHKIALNRGAAALWQSLAELHTRASLMMFTAHPDDEDGGMLAYESRYAGVDTTLFTLNRGEGGQNVMSSDFWDELGLVRTEELLAADRYYGVHQYFSRVADFGFTKTKQEAIDKWGYDRVLYDSVREVRMARPLVVTSVFAGNVSDGHGQHQVAGQMAQEVYKDAGDPTIFPDQIREGLRPWMPLKVYVRLPFATITDRGVFDYATGHWAPARFHNYVDDTWIEGMPAATTKIPEGKYDAAAGLSYLQIGRLGLNQQKSQNGGIGIPEAGPQFSAYHRYASRVAVASREATFFDGVDVTLPGIADYAPASQRGWVRDRLLAINSLVEEATRNYQVNAPEKIAPLLARGVTQTESLISEIRERPLPDDARYNMLHELTLKREQFNTALVEALGLSLDAVVSTDSSNKGTAFYHGPAETFQAAIPGQNFPVNVHLANQGSETVAITDVQLETVPDNNWTLTALGAQVSKLVEDDAADIRFSVTVSRDATVTKPYFSRPDLEQPFYDISNSAYANQPLMPYPLAARVTFKYRGANVTMEEAVQTVHFVTGQGPIMDPLIVSPAISIWVSPRAGIVPLAGKSFNVDVLTHSNVKGAANGTVALQLPAGWKSVPATAKFSTQRDGDEEDIVFEVVPTAVKDKSYRITAAASYENHSYTSGAIMVGYPGLRPYPYYRDASYRTTGVNIHLPAGLKVGYVTGTGDSVPSSLENIGVRAELLSQQDIAMGDLDHFDAIILGVRAYAVRPELKTFNDRLLDYVHQGGTLIVQYNTPEFDHNYGPYPYMLSNNPEKVIDEQSKVVLLQPDYPALKWPNLITVHDFDGWVEERGHGFMQSWDPRYIALTETHDPDQAPQKGGLLIAGYGKGFYVYDGYALYRQLPEGVPGAFRIFANLLSLSHNTKMLEFAGDQ